MSDPGIRTVPTTAAARLAVRQTADAVVASELKGGIPDRAVLEHLGRAVLTHARLPDAHLGYAMVACSNAAWRDAFAAVPTGRRLLLLPHCLRDHAGCQAPTDTAGLHCSGCGGCDIPDLTTRAEALGYKVVVAEGTGAIADDIIERGRDAVLGVACLESLERSFERVAAMGLPHVAVPLLGNGCQDTDCDHRELDALLTATRPAVPATHRSFLPLLRAASHLAAPDRLAALLGPGIDAGDEAAPVQALSRSWLGGGGKRIRAFCVLAAYAARRHGDGAFAADADAESLLTDGVRRVALAIEAMHKASLVHDDIQDEARTRYGRPAIHVSHGISTAINCGDHLLGEGYALIAGARADLGAEAVADLVAVLADAHRELCLGQGAELLARASWNAMNPLTVLDIAGRKTAPAFAAALHAGLRCAGPVSCGEALDRFARYLGECYQVLDDLDDWHGDGTDAGEDLRRHQPTILAALAAKAGWSADLARLAAGPDAVAQVRRLYEQSGAFTQARLLAERLRERALDAVQAVPGATVQELLRFLVRTATAPRE